MHLTESHVLKEFFSQDRLFFLISISQASNIKNSATVFMYHKFGVSKYPSTSVTLDQLKSHIDEFAKDKYNILPLEFIVDTVINDGDLPNNTIGITVDDADRSFLTVAWPKFKEKGFSVTLFVSTSTIIENNKNYLSWNEIRQLKAEGVVIGAHSHTHEHLANFTLEELQKEIEKSNKIFLKEIKETPNLYAYPYGETDDKIFNLLKKYHNNFAFLHAVSIYPPKISQLNLNMIKSISNSISVPVGYSDHSISTSIPSLAVALGACIIEKHITISRKEKGPDSQFSMEPKELKNLIINIETTWSLMGSKKLFIKK